MSTEPIKQEPVPGEGSPPQDTPPQDTPPEPITKEQLDQTVASINLKHQEEMNAIREDNNKQTTDLINSLNQQNAQTNQPTPTVSREEATRALSEDGDASKMFEHFDHKFAEQKQTHQTEIQNLQKLGGSQITSLAISQARSDPDMPYFKDYEKDILSAVSKSGSSDPIMMREAYRYVVGVHHEDIMKAEKEKILRQAVDEGSLLPGNGKNGRGDPVEEGPKPEEVLSERAQDLLKYKEDTKGLDADKLMQKIGKSMPFYDYKENETTGKISKTRVKRYQEGFSDKVAGKAENAKLEEEMEWM